MIHPIKRRPLYLKIFILCFSSTLPARFYPTSALSAFPPSERFASCVFTRSAGPTCCCSTGKSLRKLFCNSRRSQDGRKASIAISRQVMRYCSKTSTRYKSRGLFIQSGYQCFIDTIVLFCTKLKREV